MMSKIKLLIIIICFFFCFNLDVLAFNKDYKYNYDVSLLKKETNGLVTIEGWAIRNAGVDDNSSGFSPSLTPELGSGTNSSLCTGNDNNYYKYSLKIIPVKSNGSYQIEEAIDSSDINITYQNLNTSLTGVMCNRDSNNNCRKKKSPCYENVGWRFTFNENDLDTSKFKNGYILYLEIYSSGNDETIGFPLAVYNDKVVGLDYDYIYEGQTIDNYKVEIVVRNGYKQKISGDTSKSIDNSTDSSKGDNYKCYFSPYSYGSRKSTAIEILNVLGAGMYYPPGTKNTQKIWFYQVDSQCTGYPDTKVWAPSSWIAPAKGMAMIIDLPQIEEFEFCNPNEATTQADETKEIKACSGTKNFSGETSLTGCSVDIYDYYTLTCKENKFEASFNVNNLTSQKFSINHGGGFSVKVNMKTKLECMYDFNVEKFVSDYEVINNIINSTSNAKDKAEYIGKREKMNQILIGYYNQTNVLSDWNSGYDFDSIGVSLDVDGVSGSEKLVVNGDIKHEPANGDEWCNATETTKIITIDKNENNITYTINSKVSCAETYEKELIPDEKCLNMKTGAVESCSSSKEQISGGNKVYVDLNSTSGEIKIKVNKAGFNKNWYVNLSNCYYNTSTKNMEIKFRQIDLTDPFLQSYGDRKIGSNYSNSEYNFVSTIESDIWEKPFNYRYSLSKANVENIRSDTKELGVDSYLGKNCYFTSNNKYVCDFTRNTSNNGTNNQDKWFTKVEINE